jgi:hypothetical protein
MLASIGIRNSHRTSDYPVLDIVPIQDKTSATPEDYAAVR